MDITWKNFKVECQLLTNIFYYQAHLLTAFAFEMLRLWRQNQYHGVDYLITKATIPNTIKNEMVTKNVVKSGTDCDM